LEGVQKRDTAQDLASTASSFPSFPGDPLYRQLSGWPFVAQLMAAKPQYAAFPRFGDLNMKTLFHHQVELSNLRIESRKHEPEETHSEESNDILAKDADTQYHTLLIRL
jgi:hypothetical protein